MKQPLLKFIDSEEEIPPLFNDHQLLDAAMKSVWTELKLKKPSKENPKRAWLC